MNNLSERLRHYIDKTFAGNVSQFSKMSGLSRQSVEHYLSGSIPRVNRFSNFARAGVNINWLLTGEGDPNLTLNLQESATTQAINTVNDKQTIKLLGIDKVNRKIRIPLYEDPASAGTGNAVTDYIEQYVDIEKVYSEGCFYIKIKGLSMKGTIEDSDLVLVDPYRQYFNNSLVLCRLDDKTMVKRFKTNGTNYLLSPDNPDFDIIEITPDLKLEIIGVIVKRETYFI